MNRKSHNLRGSSTQAGNQTPRWRTVFIALVLALAIGSAGQTPPARAAPAGELVNFSMKVQNPKTPVCAGRTVTYRVIVELQQVKGAPTPPPGSFGKGLSVLNVKVEALSVNKTVGDFVGTATARTAVTLDDDLLTALPAKFKFQANKPGKTTLYFEGLVGKEYVSAKLDVKVIPCKFAVKTVLQFPVEIYAITVISDDAVMTADEAGNFTGTASMYWVYSDINLSPCTASISATDIQVELTGQLDEDGGQFEATQTFQPTMVSLTAQCPRAPVFNGQEPATVDPLTFKVASTGGVVTQTVTAGNISGPATIVVVPVEEEAAAFNADSRAALSPSAWWARLRGDNFPGFFGALLALP